MTRIRPNVLAASLACWGALGAAHAAGMPPETAAQADATSALLGQANDAEGSAAKSPDTAAPAVAGSPTAAAPVHTAAHHAAQRTSPHR